MQCFFFLCVKYSFLTFYILSLTKCSDTHTRKESRTSTSHNGCLCNQKLALLYDCSPFKRMHIIFNESNVYVAYHDSASSISFFSIANAAFLKIPCKLLSEAKSGTKQCNEQVSREAPRQWRSLPPREGCPTNRRPSWSHNEWKTDT